MAPVGVSNATVAKPADGSFKNYDEAKIQPSGNRPVNSISKGWGCERSAGFSGSITRRSLAGWSKLPSHSQQAHHRPKSARSSLKKISMLALASGRLHLRQGPRLCLWKKDDQNGSCPLAADQAPTDDGLWHRHAEVLREFHSIRQALCGKDLHHTNRITQLPTEALSSQAPS